MGGKRGKEKGGGKEEGREKRGEGREYCRSDLAKLKPLF